MSKRHVVTVKFLGFLESLAGRREDSVEVSEDATVLDVLRLLGETYGPQFSETLFRSPGQVQTHLRVFFNEKEASMTDHVAGSDAPTGRIDILVLPMTAGGAW